MAAAGHIENGNWKQIDIESCVIPLFLLILAWRIHFWHRFCILTSPTIQIQNGRLRPYWKCNPCNITFPTKCGIESPFLASLLYFDESTYQNSRWPPCINFIFFFYFQPYNPYYLLNFTRETRFQEFVFISWYHFLYFDEPKHLNSRWPPVVILKMYFKRKCSYVVPFYLSHVSQSFCILTSLNVEIQDCRPLPFPLFSDLSHPIHCSCWNSFQAILVDSIWCFCTYFHKDHQEK